MTKEHINLLFTNFTYFFTRRVLVSRSATFGPLWPRPWIGSHGIPGCPWNRESISNWRCLFTSHCMVLLRHTCRTAINSSRTWDVDISGLPTSARVLSRRQSQIDDRNFSVAGPWLWNNLPTEIRGRDTMFGHYRQLLEVFLFV